MTIINERTVLIRKYTGQGLPPAAAYRKATEVMEMRDDARAGNPDMAEGELLAAAEKEWLAGEEAMRDHLGRVNKLTITPTDEGLRLQRGEKGLLLSGHEIAVLLEQSRRYLAGARKAKGRAGIHAQRQAEGREAFRVVGGRLANEQAA